MRHTKETLNATNYNMSTKNRGRIIDANRMGLSGPIETEGGLNVANIFEQPDGWVTGAHGDSVGGNDPDNDGCHCPTDISRD